MEMVFDDDTIWIACQHLAEKVRERRNAGKIRSSFGMAGLSALLADKLDRWSETTSADEIEGMCVDAVVLLCMQFPKAGRSVDDLLHEHAEKCTQRVYEAAVVDEDEDEANGIYGEDLDD